MGYQNANIAYLSVDKKPVSFMVTGEEQTYAAGESREITIVSDGTRYMSCLTDGGVKISYYRVNENDDTLTPAKKCVEAGRYLYEIQLTDEAAERYDIKNRYVYSAHYAADPKTPNIDEYDNIGFMDIRTAYTAGKNVGTYSVTPYGLSSDKYDITYEPGTITVEPKTLTASDFTVTAENRTYDGTSGVNIDSVQLIGILPTDSVTASATGVMLNSDAGDNKTVYAKVTLDGNWGEVYALDTESVQTTVDIKKALITGIKITAQDKKYSKTDDALVRVDEITGVLAMDASLVRVSGEAKFDTASAGDNKTVTFIATELTGRKTANYEFESPDAMQAMAEASITPLNVTFTLGALAFGYDTDEKPVAVSAFDETGAVFTDYDIVYRDADGNDLGFVPKEAGSYLVGIEITDSNYVTEYTDKEMFIIEADQEALSILGLPGTVAFGDEFTLEAIGGSGTGALIWESSSPDVTVEPENGNARP